MKNQTKKLMRAFVIFLWSFSMSNSFANSDTPHRTLSIQYNQVAGPNNKFYAEVVGAGRAAEGLRADWQRDLALVHRECGFKYIRFHGILHDEMGVYSEDKQGKPIYNFQYIDALFDSILNLGMKPFVELAFMPDKLASGDKTVFWWKGNITPPENHEKWQKLIQTLTQHWTDRYGEQEVKQWYFEVWNEPNLNFFWSGSQEEYFKMYDHTAKAIKMVSPQYRVGGPATAGNAWITETIEFALKNKSPLDFITTHDYAVSGGGFDDTGNQQLFLIPAPHAISGNVRRAKNDIKESGLPTLPLHYTEWSASYSPRDPVHDSYISAPFIISKIKETENVADSMSYWTFTDIFEENGVVPSPFHGGFGMVNFQGLKKPSFYAYQMLNRLGDQTLKTEDPQSWITRSAKGVQVLFWNYSPPITKESNQVYFKKNVPAKSAGMVEIKINDLPAGKYKMNVYQTGHQVNDVYADYLKMGSPMHLKREQVKELAIKNNGNPIETISIVIKNNQPFTKTINIRENDVFMVVLDKQ
jgi:xylan 1,4-beta-xylosidase